MAQQQCPPEGFSDSDWEKVCKTPFSGDLTRWVSQQLAGQDTGEVCSCLNVDFRTGSLQDNDKQAFYKIVSRWLQNHNYPREKVYLSRFILLLAELNVTGLEAGNVTRIISDICDNDAQLCFANDNCEPGSNSSAGTESCSEYVSPSSGVFLFSEVLPISCTQLEVQQPSTPEAESGFPNPEQALSPQLVIGTSSRSSSESGGNGFDKDTLRELAKEVNTFQKKFARLLQQAFSIFKESKLPVDQLRVYLNQRCADEHGEIPLFSNLMIDILSQATTEELFLHLSRIGAWNFLSYFILEEVLDVFEIDQEDFNSKFSTYKTDVQLFKERTVLMQFLTVWGGRCDDDQVFPGYRSVIARVIGDTASFTIENACDLGSLLAGQFNLKQLAFRLVNGNHGSVCIKWLVPAAVAKHMLKVMKSKKRPDLLQLGILELVVEKTIFKSKFRYESIYKLSLDNPRLFWGGVGAKELIWRKHSREVFTFNKETGEFHWFRGAQLNVSENCLDIHVKCCPDKKALIWEQDNGDSKEVTYRQLFDQTCRLANVLKKRGINKGDVVVICMPTMPLAVASMLACARIGAVHCVLFSDFSDKVLHQRIKEVEAKAVITTDIRVIDGQTKNLKEKIVKALIKKDLSVRTVFVAKRSGHIASLAEEVKGDGPLDCDDVAYFSLEKEMQEVPPDCDPVPMDGEDILFIAYTSGTQKGTSKAVYHKQAGFLLYTKLTYKFMFNLAPDDIMGCVSDLGWVAAHCYVVYGPLSNGNTTLLFESTATYPDEGRYWKVVEKLKLTHLYTVPSVIKELMIREKRGSGQLDKYNRSSLKTIALGGEPVPPDIEEWCYSEVGKGKCLFIDNWGQTELGGAGIVRWKAPEGHARADFPTQTSFALFGVNWDTDREKLLYLKQPLPGMGKFILASGEHEKKTYEQVYYSKENGFLTNDILEVKQNFIKVMGRKGRILVTEGAWLSLANIEDQLRIRMTADTKNEICDVQVVKGSQEMKSNKPDPLLVLLLVDSAVNYKGDELAVVYQQTVSIVNQITAEILQMQTNFDLEIYILSKKEVGKYFQTATKKTCYVIIENFLVSRKQFQDSSRPSLTTDQDKKCEVIERSEVKRFFLDNSPFAITVH